MIGIIKRGNRHKKWCFVTANGIDYFVHDPFKKWADGDVVSFIPGQNDKGAVAKEVMIIERKKVAESKSS